MRTPLLCALALAFPLTARADDDAQRLIVRVNTAMQAARPIMALYTATIHFKNGVETLNGKSYQMENQSGTETRGGKSVGTVPVNLNLLFSAQVLDPLSPSVTLFGQLGVETRTAARATLAGVTYDVVETTLIGNKDGQFAQMSVRVDLKRLVRRIYIGADGMIHHIAGEITWAPDTPPQGAGGQKPDETASFEVDVDVMRKPVVFSRAASSLPDHQIPIKAEPGEQQTTMALSPDEHLLAVGYQSGLVRLLDAVTGQERLRLTGHLTPVVRCVFAPDGKTLASADALVLALWNVTTGKLIRTLRGYQSISTLLFMPGGGTVLTAGNDGPVHLWDVATGRQLRTLDNSHASLLAVSPSGSRLATISAQHGPMLWDTISWKPLPMSSNPGIDACTVAFSPDGRLVAVGDRTGTVRVWDAGSGRLLTTVKDPAGPDYGLDFAADGKTLLAVDIDERGDLPTNRMGVTSWDVATWHVTQSLDVGGADYNVYGAQLLGGRQLVQLRGLDAIDVWKLPLSPPAP